MTDIFVEFRPDPRKWSLPEVVVCSMQDSADDSSKMVAGGLCSSFGVKIRAAGSISGSSKEFELPALSELTNEPLLMGDPPEVTDLPITKRNNNNNINFQIKYTYKKLIIIHDLQILRGLISKCAFPSEVVRNRLSTVGIALALFSVVFTIASLCCLWCALPVPVEPIVPAVNL